MENTKQNANSRFTPFASLSPILFHICLSSFIMITFLCFVYLLLLLLRWWTIWMRMRAWVAVTCNRYSLFRRVDCARTHYISASFSDSNGEIFGRWTPKQRFIATEQDARRERATRVSFLLYSALHCRSRAQNAWWRKSANERQANSVAIKAIQLQTFRLPSIVYWMT